jgi:hypothetical protein
MRTYWLSMHVPYRCRDSGVCCSSGWPIPLEAVRRAAVDGAVSDQRIDVAADWLQVVSGQPGDVAGVLAQTAAGRCVFHANPGCEIQRVLGPTAMPSACAHFPRECLIDSRGVFVTLSHYCPTAASCLFEHVGGVEIVEGPPAVPGQVEGFDARDVMPPLLTAGVLMDHAGYAAWEAHAVAVLAGAAADVPVDDRLVLLRRHALELSEWRPGRTTLADAVRSLSGAAETEGPAEIDWSLEHDLFAKATRALPASHSWPEYPKDVAAAWTTHARRGWDEQRAAVGRFLAAHAFASWVAYQGDGVYAIVRRLHVALAVLRAEVLRACGADGRSLDGPLLIDAIRRTDLLLVHLADRDALARGLVSS